LEEGEQSKLGAFKFYSRTPAMSENSDHRG
jgi:hypothetical protein